MQMLQVNFDDYIPKCQIFVEQEEDVDKLVRLWMSPSTLWQGRPVIGFVAETFLDDLETVGFKHFNPMWSFPTTSVYQNWEPMTFGMAPWHLVDETEHSKDALVSQKARRRRRPTAPRHGTMHIHSNMLHDLLIYCDRQEPAPFYDKHS